MGVRVPTSSPEPHSQAAVPGDGDQVASVGREGQLSGSEGVGLQLLQGRPRAHLPDPDGSKLLGLRNIHREALTMSKTRLLGHFTQGLQLLAHCSWIRVAPGNKQEATRKVVNRGDGHARRSGRMLDVREGHILGVCAISD